MPTFNRWVGMGISKCSETEQQTEHNDDYVGGNQKGRVADVQRGEAQTKKGDNNVAVF